MSRRASGLLASLGPLPFCVCLLVLTAVLAELIGTPDVIRAEQQLLVYVFLTVGLFVFIGLTGVLSFGHSAFAAVGAYMTAFLTMPVALKSSLISALPPFLVDAHVPLVAAMGVAAVVAMVVGVIIGSPLMRLSGLQAGIATLALLFVVISVISNWSDLTNGPGSLPGVPLDITIPFALAAATVACLLAWGVVRSRVGHLLSASREDERAAKAVGVSVVRLRIVALAISAALMGAGGGMLSHYLGVLSPAAFGLNLTFLTLAMLIVGGRTTLSGAVLGAVVISIASELCRHLETGVSIGSVHTPSVAGIEQLLIALAMLAILIFRPQGLAGRREIGLAPKLPASRSAKPPLWPREAPGREGSSQA